MSENKSISRRAFLLLALGAGAALVAAPELPQSVPGWIAGRGALGARVGALIGHQQSARVVGLAYLRQYPHEADTALLLGRLAEGLPGGAGALAASTDQQLKQMIAQAVSRDFEAERVVQLQGWIMSATEARLCALAALA